MNYQQALEFIHGRHRFKKNPDLETMKLLLSKLDNPQEDINAIHVAGTNGKGSTVAYLRNIFQADGKKVGTFTSPFLIRFNERISVDGNPISDSELIKLVEQIKPIVEQLDVQLQSRAPTEFEVVTAMMFLYFAKHPVDVVIVEVGIGGLLDSTNVLNPKVSVITTIGMDHMQILGDTLEKIAFQKAGIIKDKTPVVVGNIAPSPLNVIKEQASSKQAPITILNQQFKTTSHRTNTGWKQEFDYEDEDRLIRHLVIKMVGDYQIDNASCAIKAYIEYQLQNSEDVNNFAISNGLLNTQWAGRFERVNDTPIVVLDGAHNIDAVQEISKLITEHFRNIDVHIIIAILSDKNYMEMLNTLGKLSNVHMTLTEFQAYGNRKAVDMPKIIKNIQSVNPVSFESDWRMAVAKVANEMSDDDMMLITGSLYFISDVRKLFVTK